MVPGSPGPALEACPAEQSPPGCAYDARTRESRIAAQARARLALPNFRNPLSLKAQTGYHGQPFR